MGIVLEIEHELDGVEDAVEALWERHKPSVITRGSTGIMTTANIAFINESSVITDAALLSTITDLQQQIVKDFGPVWGQDAKLRWLDKHTAPAAEDWQIIILDDSDQAGALGYHDVTSTGQPLGKVFARTDLQNGLSWTVTVSHELLEMLGDPLINTTVMLGDSQGIKLFAYEACDSCEADSLAYMIGNTKVSNFVFPSFFGVRPNNPGVDPKRYDMRGDIKVNVPDALAAGDITKAILPGGYLGYWTPSAGWVQATGGERAADYFAVAAPPGSRRERRQTTRQYMPSLGHDEITANRKVLRNRLLEMYPG